MTLITLSHGSRHPRSRADALALTAAAGELLGTPARAAFLDFDEDTLEKTCAELVAAGTGHATVVPLLFTDAFHHRHDVPAAVAEAEKSTGIKLSVAPNLGTGDDIAELLRQATPPNAPRLVLYSVGSSAPEANAAVADLAERVGATSVLATGGGPEKVIAGGPAHVLALTVSSGLLLDALATATKGQSITVGEPLGEALAPIVAERFRSQSPSASPCA